jgi:excisionase family DNA binding protein
LHASYTSMGENQTRLLQIEKLAEALGVKVRTVRGWMHTKKVPYLKLGHRQCLFDESKVRAALQRFEVRPIK